MQKNVLKIIFYSALVSINIVVWYEILGIKFLLAMLILILIVVLTEGSKKWTMK